MQEVEDEVDEIVERRMHEREAVVEGWREVEERRLDRLKEKPGLSAYECSQFKDKASRYWDQFYKSNTDRFFKDRHYVSEVRSPMRARLSTKQIHTHPRGAISPVYSWNKSGEAYLLVVRSAGRFYALAVVVETLWFHFCSAIPTSSSMRQTSHRAQWHCCVPGSRNAKREKAPLRSSRVVTLLSAISRQDPTRFWHVSAARKLTRFCCCRL